MARIPGAPLSANLQADDDFGEMGVLGLEMFSGYIRMAYNAELYWPTCFPLYDRIRRSDPEVSLIRTIWGSLARNVEFRWEMKTDEQSDNDAVVLEFLEQVLNDLESGIDEFRDTLLGYVPFLGFGVWEIVGGLRRQDWVPPDDSSWRSQYDDGKIGIRKLAFRDHSSFSSWDEDDKTGQVRGMIQMDTMRGMITIPFERALHITFGDSHNPEGLSPLEAVWRLERLKYGLEVVQGIGFEHAAGHAKFTVKNKITEDDKLIINKAARAILSAQEGNYMALPENIDAEVIDVGFQAASTLLEAIRYYGLLKLQIFNMQWIAIASTAGTGAYAAMADASGMFVETYNAMMAGFAAQIGDQLWNWLVTHNDLGEVSARPRLVATPVEKTIPLSELATFVQTFASMFPLADEDILAIRHRSGFLPGVLPPEEEEQAPKRRREPMESENEEEIEEIPEDELTALVSEFEAWAQVNRPEVYQQLLRPADEAVVSS